MVPVVGDAVAEAVGFGDEDAAPLIDAESGGRVDLVVLEGGEDAEFRAGGNGDSGDHLATDESGVEGLAVPGGVREPGVGIVGEDDVVGHDESPGSGLLVEEPEPGLLSTQVAHVPGPRAEKLVVLPGFLPHHPVTDQELDRGFSPGTPAADQETDVGQLDGELGGGQGAGAVTTCRKGRGEGFLGVALHLAGEFALAAGGGRLSEGISLLGPGSKSVAFKGLEDDVGVLGGGGRDRSCGQQEAELFHRWRDARV